MKPIIGLTMHTGEKKLEINDTYIQSIELAGGIPLCIPHVKEDDIAAILDKIDGLVLIGGHDVDPFFYGEEPHEELGMFHTKRDMSDIALAKSAYARHMPILGICRGHQVLNVAFGGSLIQHIPAQWEKPLAHVQKSLRDEATHHVDIHDEKLAEIFQSKTIRTNSFHHQAIQDVAEGFVSAGVAKDGLNEAIVHTTHPFCIGVQWHPEALAPAGDEPSKLLFQAFMKACQEKSYKK